MKTLSTTTFLHLKIFTLEKENCQESRRCQVQVLLVSVKSMIRKNHQRFTWKLFFFLHNYKHYICPIFSRSSKKEDRPPLRQYLMDGDYFIGSTIASTLVKLSLKFDKLEADPTLRSQFCNECMLIIACILHLGRSGECGITFLDIFLAEWHHFIEIGLQVCRRNRWTTTMQSVCCSACALSGTVAQQLRRFSRRIAAMRWRPCWRRNITKKLLKTR